MAADAEVVDWEPGPKYTPLRMTLRNRHGRPEVMDLPEEWHAGIECCGPLSPHMRLVRVPVPVFMHVPSQGIAGITGGVNEEEREGQCEDAEDAQTGTGIRQITGVSKSTSKMTTRGRVQEERDQELEEECEDESAVGEQDVATSMGRQHTEARKNRAKSKASAKNKQEWEQDFEVESGEDSPTKSERKQLLEAGKSKAKRTARGKGKEEYERELNEDEFEEDNDDGATMSGGRQATSKAKMKARGKHEEALEGEELEDECEGDKEIVSKRRWAPAHDVVKATAKRAVQGIGNDEEDSEGSVLTERVAEEDDAAPGMEGARAETSRKATCTHSDSEPVLGEDEKKLRAAARRSQPDHLGLQALWARARIPASALPLAQSWCSARGLETEEQLRENAYDLSEDVGLWRLEARRFFAALGLKPNDGFDSLASSVSPAVSPRSVSPPDGAGRVLPSEQEGSVRQLLGACRLTDKWQAVLTWCEATGITSLEELARGATALEIYLGLQPAEILRFRRSLGNFVQAKSTFVGTADGRSASGSPTRHKQQTAGQQLPCSPQCSPSPPRSSSQHGYSRVSPRLVVNLNGRSRLSAAQAHLETAAAQGSWTPGGGGASMAPPRCATASGRWRKRIVLWDNGASSTDIKCLTAADAVEAAKGSAATRSERGFLECSQSSASVAAEVPPATKQASAVTLAAARDAAANRAKICPAQVTSKTPGLGVLLQETLLLAHLAAADKWCQAHAISSKDKLFSVAQIEKLAEALALRPLERRRLLAAVAEQGLDAAEVETKVKVSKEEVEEEEGAPSAKQPSKESTSKPPLLDNVSDLHGHLSTFQERISRVAKRHSLHGAAIKASVEQAFAQKRVSVPNVSFHGGEAETAAVDDLQADSAKPRERVSIVSMGAGSEMCSKRDSAELDVLAQDAIAEHYVLAQRVSLVMEKARSRNSLESQTPGASMPSASPFANAANLATTVAAGDGSSATPQSVPALSECKRLGYSAQSCRDLGHSEGFRTAGYTDGYGVRRG